MRCVPGKRDINRQFLLGGVLVCLWMCSGDVAKEVWCACVSDGGAGDCGGPMLEQACWREGCWVDQQVFVCRRMEWSMVEEQGSVCNELGTGGGDEDDNRC